MLRVIREVQPTWVVGENVLGLVNWSNGLVFEEVQADLEAEGYQVQPYVLPAAGVGAPHRRDRVWFVAYAKGNNNRRKCGWLANKNGQENHGRQRTYITKHPHIGNEGNAADTETSKNTMCSGRIQREIEQEGTEIRKQRHISARGSERIYLSEGDAADTKGIIGNWSNFPTQSPVCSRNDELSSRLDGITFSKWRQESIKAYGNAIVPQVAYQIFKSINQYNDAV